MKNDIKNKGIVTGVLLISVGMLVSLFIKYEIPSFISFGVGALYMVFLYKLLSYEQPDPEQETEIMYFEKTSELQEWTEKLKKEEVEVLYYGTVWNALVKHRDMITQDKVNNYCIIYKYN